MFWIWNKRAGEQFLSLFTVVSAKTLVSAGNHHPCQRNKLRSVVTNMFVSIWPPLHFSTVVTTCMGLYINSQKTFHVTDCFTIGAFTAMCHWTLRDVSWLDPWSVFEQLSSSLVCFVVQIIEVMFISAKVLCAYKKMQINFSNGVIEYHHRTVIWKFRFR